MAASATTDPAQSGDLPPDVRAALQRIRDGSRDPADHAVLRRALAAGQVQIVSGDRAVAIGASVNDAVIVTGDGNVITIIKGGAASDLLAAGHDLRCVLFGWLLWAGCGTQSDRHGRGRTCSYGTLRAGTHEMRTRVRGTR